MEVAWYKLWVWYCHVCVAHTKHRPKKLKSGAMTIVCGMCGR